MIRIRGGRSVVGDAVFSSCVSLSESAETEAFPDRPVRWTYATAVRVDDRSTDHNLTPRREPEQSPPQRLLSLPRLHGNPVSTTTTSLRRPGAAAAAGAGVSVAAVAVGRSSARSSPCQNPENSFSFPKFAVPCVSWSSGTRSRECVVVSVVKEARSH